MELNPDHVGRRTGAQDSREAIVAVTAPRDHATLIGWLADEAVGVVGDVQCGVGLRIISRLDRIPADLRHTGRTNAPDDSRDHAESPAGAFGARIEKELHA